MESHSILEGSSDLNLSLAPPSTEETAQTETTHENVLVQHTNFHTGSSSMQATNMHNEIPVAMITPYATLVMAKSSEKTVVDETNFFGAHCAASATNVGLCLLARNQECV
ncbi:unnamed protein product [Prunus brigantina]